MSSTVVNKDDDLYDLIVWISKDPCWLSSAGFIAKELLNLQVFLPSHAVDALA